MVQDSLFVNQSINSDRLHTLLEGYDEEERQFLLDGFAHGFHIPYSGERLFRLAHNHKSCLENPNIFKNHVQREIAEDRIFGPFITPPFENLICSPLALIPKKDPNSFRLIHDLSYPEGKSINDHISSEHTIVSYDNIDTIISLVKIFGKNSLMAKADILEAYRQIPINPADFELLGFTSKDMEGNIEYYFDTRLAQGLSISCQIFEKFSTSLQWIMENKYGANMSHLIDDFFFISSQDSTNCYDSLTQFFSLCGYVGVPIKHEKTVMPTTCITIYGIEIDSNLMLSRLPDDKVFKIRFLLESFQKRKKVSLKELQSLIGLLNFATSVVVPGRAFLRRLIDLTIGVRKPHFMIRLTNEARADILAWYNFMSGFNGKSMFMFDNWVSSDVIRLYSDAASTKGFAAVFGSRWFAHYWPEGMGNLHINIMELFPIVVALEMWGGHMANHKILILTDNACTKDVINKMSSKCSVTMKLVRRLVLSGMNHNTVIRAKHIPGKLNLVADSLSRFDFQNAHKLAPWLDAQASQIPCNLLSI